MDNKKDWEEIERYMKEVENKKIELHNGIDITEMLSKKKIRNGEKIIIKLMKRISKPTIIIFSSIIVFIIVVISGAYLDNIKNAHNINVKQYIEDFQNVKINQVSQNTDEKGYVRGILI